MSPIVWLIVFCFSSSSYIYVCLSSAGEGQGRGLPRVALAAGSNEAAQPRPHNNGGTLGKAGTLGAQG